MMSAGLPFAPPCWRPARRFAKLIGGAGNVWCGAAVDVVVCTNVGFSARGGGGGKACERGCWGAAIRVLGLS